MNKPTMPWVAIVLGLTAGCTTLQPQTARLVEPGTDIRIHLSDAQDVNLASVTVRNVVQVEGTLTRWNGADEALIFSSRVTTGGGVVQETQGEILRFSESNIEMMEAQTLDRRKTTIAAVLGAAAVLGIVLAIGSRGNVGGGGSDDPPPPQSLIPIPFSIRIP